MWRETVNIDRNFFNDIELGISAGSWSIHSLTVVWGS